MGRKRDKTFVLTWLDAVAAADVPPAAKAVALAMATHADYGTGLNMRAGTARLAHEARLGDRQTRTMVKALKRAGLITWDGVPTAPGKARNYSLTVPPHANGGSGVPPLEQDATGNGGSGVPPSQEPTVAKIDTNGGKNRHERWQPAATHQGHTRARPARTLRGAPEGRAAARDNSTSSLTEIAAALTHSGLAPAVVDQPADGSHGYVTQSVEVGGCSFDLQVQLDGDDLGQPTTVTLDYPEGSRIKVALIHWRDRYGLPGNVHDSELDTGSRIAEITFYGELTSSQLVTALPDLVSTWVRHCQRDAGQNAQATVASPSPLVIAMTETACTTQVMHQLRNVLLKHAGTSPVQVNVTAAGASNKVLNRLQLPDDLNVTRSPALTSELLELIGPECLT